ncbi:MAG: nitroreductase [Bacteroidetes bacterium]|nr:MAG: nitroreductase [Bacteroidota bacterium]
MQETSSIEQLIARRRTIKPDKYTGNTVDDSSIEKLLTAANWAPTHGYTEPWRFVVFTGAGKEKLISMINQLEVEDHGENEVRLGKLRDRVEQSSHVIAIGMKRGENPKIPAIEEAQAVAAAVQNMWLVATELGLGAYWSTGALGYDERMTKALGWTGEEDSAMGFLYIGEFEGEWPTGRRISSIDSKVRWER